MEPARPPQRPARAGWIVLAALLTELVVIGAAANQWVTTRIFRQVYEGSGSDGVRDLKETLIVYNWRWTPQSGDTEHSWLGQILMILTVLVVSGLLIFAVLRGVATFGRVLLTCWMAVIVATMLGTWVRGLVTDVSGGPTHELRITKAVFGQLAPGPVVFFASLVLGLAVGLVAGIVAVATRRPAAPEVPPSEAEPPPYVPPDPPPYYGGPPPATTRLPAVEPSTSPSRAQPDQQTTRFPQPPDDYGIEE